MSSKRATVYLEADLHRALRLKAAQSETTISTIVNEAVKRDLLEDAIDLDDYRARKREPSKDFESVVRELRRRGKL